MTDVSPVTPLHKNGAFITLWSLGLLNSTGRWLETLVVAIFVLDQTGSPFVVAMMLVLRLSPLALFGMFGGVLAQRLNRYTVLRYASGLIVCTAVVTFTLAYNDLLEVWHLGVVSFVSGLVWTTDFPARRTLMGDLAGPARVARAMSLDILAGSSTRMLGPLVGGILYQQVGIAGALFIGSCLYLFGFALVWLTPRKPESKPQEDRSVAEDIKTGIRVLREHDFLPGLLVITVIFNVWAFPFISMIPVVGKEVLNLSDALTGLLASAEGAGALVGAIGLSLFAKSEHSRYYYVFAVLAFCVFAALFSLSNSFYLSLCLLLIVGLVSAAFGAMQSALVLMNAPEGYERQMMGILAVCIGTAPIGFLHIGLLADLYGANTACTIVAVEGICAMLFAIWRWPKLLSGQPIQGSADPLT